MNKAPAAALLAVLLLHAAAVPIDLVDDAYISFRYAWNLAHGNGLAFNPGERVEGYSNLTWVLLAAGILRLGLPLEVAIRWLGLAGLFATTLLLAHLLGRSGVDAARAGAAALLLAATTAWVVPVLNGLEGPLFSFLLLASLGLHARLLAGASRGTALLCATAGVALAATRPEGAFLQLLAALTTLVLDARARRGPPAAVVWTALGAFLAGFALLTAWRLAAYGSFLPNAVAAKLGAQAPFGRFLTGSLGGGLSYDLGFLRETWPLWLLLLAALVRAPWARPPAQARTSAALALVLLAGGFLVPLANNGDWMPHHRLLAPYLPLAVAVPALLLDARPARAVLLLGAAAVLLLSPRELHRPSWSNLLEHRPSAFHRAWCAWGRLLQAAQAAQAAAPPVVATEVLGVFGYCAPGVRLRDLNGLVDREIAEREPSGGVFGRKTRPATLEALHPDVVAINDLRYWRELLHTSPWFAREMATLACPALLSEHLYLFVRRDSPLAGRLACGAGAGLPAAEAFLRAGCLRQGWPYDFPRPACPSP